MRRFCLAVLAIPIMLSVSHAAVRRDSDKGWTLDGGGIEYRFARKGNAVTFEYFGSRLVLRSIRNSPRRYSLC